MAGVKEAEHVYLYAVSAVDNDTRIGYLDLAYRLGRDFASSQGVVQERVVGVPATMG